MRAKRWKRPPEAESRSFFRFARGRVWNDDRELLPGKDKFPVLIVSKRIASCHGTLESRGTSDADLVRTPDAASAGSFQYERYRNDTRDFSGLAVKRTPGKYDALTAAETSEC
jgi:hypothetical protein